MSNKERIIEILDAIPDYKIGYVWQLMRKQMMPFVKEC